MFTEPALRAGLVGFQGAYCDPRGQVHGASQAETQPCIELVLSSVPGSTGIATRGAGAAPPSIREFQERYCAPRQHQHGIAGIVPCLDLVVRRDMRRLALRAIGPQVTTHPHFCTKVETSGNLRQNAAQPSKTTPQEDA